MRIASFVTNGREGYGVVKDDVLIPATRQLRARFPDLKAILAGNALQELRDSLDDGAAVKLPAAALRPVVPNPGKILCIGANYQAHMREMGHQPPAHPLVFVRFPDSLVGHAQPVVRPRESTQFDYEGELAVVIGESCRRVKPATALERVAGYACFMDGTIRDYQRHTSQFIPGKNFPASGAFGPWLMTADEIPRPEALHLVTRLNGRTVQEASLVDLVFDIPTLIAYCSSFCRLDPGDVIVTGSPSGVGAAARPPRWLQPGDVIEVQVEGVGTLRNAVTAED